MTKIIVTGATGTVGAEVVRQALLHPAITQVTVLARRPLPSHIPSSHAKLDLILHKDFAVYPPALLDRLQDHDGCIWALGRSSNGMSERDYEVLTVDYAVAAAQAFGSMHQQGHAPGKFVFSYVSGEGADQEEKAWTMFGRVKGRAERRLAELRSAFPSSLATYSLRPAGINPVNPTPEMTRSYKTMMGIQRALRPLLASYIIDADVLARGLLETVIKGSKGTIENWEGKGQAGNAGVWTNEEIKALARGSELR